MNRFYSIDVLRGLIMIIMALDHVISGIALQHPIEIELPFPSPQGPLPGHFPGYHNLTEQLSRLVTHVCAPGFQLLAGMGLAISVIRSRERGVPDSQITRDLAVRGVVLILIEWLFMCPYIYQAPFLFLVLCCIGASTLCFIILRFLPKQLIGLAGLAIIGMAPLYAPAVVKNATLQQYPLLIWKDVAFAQDNWFNVMYPVLPWLGCFALGWWIGLELHQRQDSASVKRQATYLIVGGLLLFLLGFGLRWSGSSYAERIPLEHPVQKGVSLEDARQKGLEIVTATPSDPWFWQFAKYPPSLVFLLLTLGVLLLGLGLLRPIDLKAEVPAWCRFVSVYGRTALFYFVVHFFVIGIASVLLGVPPGDRTAPRYSFAAAYLVWATIVLLLWPICRGYDKLRQHHRSSLRYF